MRKIVIVLFILIGCSKQPHDYDQRTSYYKNVETSYTSDSIVKCVTFNIHLGFKANKDPWDKDQIGADYEQVKNIADILKQIDPDIVALQEVPRNRYNAVIKNFLEELASELSMNYAFGAHGYNDPYGIYPVEGEWGNAILTKYRIEEINNVEVEYIDKWEKRSMIDAKLMINNSVSLHALSLHHLPIQEGIPNTASYVKKMDEQVILMGDYNYIGQISNFSEIGLIDVDTTYLNHGVDRIFVSENTAELMEIGTLKDTLWTSDHPANYCILGIKD